MSTRAFFGVRIDGVDKLMYNHHDGYPTGLGSCLIEQIHKADLSEWRKQARRLILVPQHHVHDQQGELQQVYDKLRSLLSPRFYNFVRDLDEIGSGSWSIELREKLARRITVETVGDNESIGQFVRDLEGNLDLILQLGVYTEGSDLIGPEGITCNWGYILDLDKLEFLVFDNDDQGSADVSYYPNGLLAQYSLNAIPENWAEECQAESLLMGELGSIANCASRLFASNKEEDFGTWGLALEDSCAWLLEFENWSERLIDRMPDWPSTSQRLVLEVLRVVGGTNVINTIADTAPAHVAALAKEVSEKSDDPDLVSDRITRLVNVHNSGLD